MVCRRSCVQVGEYVAGQPGKYSHTMNAGVYALLCFFGLAAGCVLQGVSAAVAFVSNRCCNTPRVHAVTIFAASDRAQRCPQHRVVGRHILQETRARQRGVPDRCLCTLRGIRTTPHTNCAERAHTG